MNGESPYRDWAIKGLLETTRKCPRKLVTEDSRQWLGLYGHYKSGFLAISGGVIDQPNAYLEAMNIIDSWAERSD